MPDALLGHRLMLRQVVGQAPLALRHGLALARTGLDSQKSYSAIRLRFRASSSNRLPAAPRAATQATSAAASVRIKPSAWNADTATDGWTCGSPRRRGCRQRPRTRFGVADKNWALTV